MDIFTGERLPDSCAICLLGHGSRDPDGTQEFLALWKKLRERNFCQITEGGFLEFAKPTISEALSACHRHGIKNIIILPSILFSGKHTQKDIPKIANEMFQGLPEINLIFAEPLAPQPELMEVCRKRIEQGESGSQEPISRSETLLMTVAHGSRNTDFNTQVEKNLSRLGKKLGFGKTLTCFAGNSQHFLADMQNKFTSQKFRRVILLPFFLFTGVWVKRVHSLADTFQGKYPDIEFLKIPHLGYHDLIVEALIQRVREKVQ
jgi:precorrin-8X/cobalt-precorrin-8 methylmutase